MPGSSSGDDVDGALVTTLAPGAAGRSVKPRPCPWSSSCDDPADERPCRPSSLPTVRTGRRGRKRRRAGRNLDEWGMLPSVRGCPKNSPVRNFSTPPFLSPPEMSEPVPVVAVKLRIVFRCQDRQNTGWICAVVLRGRVSASVGLNSGLGWLH